MSKLPERLLTMGESCRAYSHQVYDFVQLRRALLLVLLQALRPPRPDGFGHLPRPVDLASAQDDHARPLQDPLPTWYHGICRHGVPHAVLQALGKKTRKRIGVEVFDLGLRITRVILVLPGLPSNCIRV